MDTIDVENNLKVYYREIFPAELLYTILGITKQREISFFTGSGVYMRYLTFDSVESFREKLEKTTPRKIDIGSTYDIPPSKVNQATPISRELVFDIDLTDYPRTCCKEKTVCKLCYEKIKCAVKVIDYIVSEELGFRNYGFVFSGRRGVHCWILEMKDIPSHVRNDIYKYFNGIVEKHLFVKEYVEIMEEFNVNRLSTGDLIDGFFPRLDKDVTVSMNHLLKMPFSVHPDTMKLSIPLDPNRITEFEDIPTLFDVVSKPEILEPYYAILRKWVK